MHGALLLHASVECGIQFVLIEFLLILSVGQIGIIGSVVCQYVGLANGLPVCNVHLVGGAVGRDYHQRNMAVKRLAHGWGLIEQS